ncbi:MAG TPA: thioredoxin domain-containing protein [Anaeromyxobacteraceae bacterium]|nr:thioredoxin domain-containing protein [Anaeromyxobacteraceae bacterium]
MKHISWIVALIVGLILGAVGGRMAGINPIGKKLSDFPPTSVREGDLPAGTLAGLSDAQKYQVLKGVSDRYGRQQAPAPQRQQEDPKAVYKIPVEDSPARGPQDALVTVVESSDFECPFCKRVQPTMKQLEEAYPGKLRFVFKHNPLPFHPKAMPSAVASEEARQQGGAAKFWAMHDKLFESNPNLDRPTLEKLAQDLGLDMAAFKKALDEQRYEQRIRRDQALAQSVGASGTPTFFINGRKVVGAVPLEVFKSVVDEELKKAEDLVKSGVAAHDVYAKTIENGKTAPAMINAGPAAPQQPPPPPPPAASRVGFRPDDPLKGPKVAKVTVVEFSDFQCPFCSRVNPTLKQLAEAYPKDVRIVWKHQPLPFHSQAMPAASAAEAAREQGKFWQMHDLLFENQQSLGPAQYEQWAAKLGLDSKKFQAAESSDKTKARIQEDMQLGSKVGANGTPTLFVNCRQIVGAQPYESFKKMVDEEIAKADQMQKQGAKLDGSFYERICEANVKAVAH